jgi:Fe-S-cluster-containing dehydrogenase component/DMSO reductase anchor subunit
MTRLAFVFDQRRCTGCHACRLACTIENGLPFPESWRQVVSFNPRHDPALPAFHLSLACNHCAEPACMHACPARAYCRDPATGAVLIDESKCIGCRYCTWACPYDAPRYNARRGVVTKCTFCVERLHDGSVPACADYCPTGALTVARCEETDLTTSGAGFPDGSVLRPAVRIIPWPDAAAPVADERSPSSTVGSPAPASTITLRSEWPLAIFTLAAAVLAALFTGHVVGRVDLAPALFLGIAAPAMGLSVLHLGRKQRAWRAVLGLRTSWLSREVVAFSAFVGLGTVALSEPALLGPVGAAAILLGALALAAVDRVYSVARLPAGSRPHSAGILLTAVLAFGVIAQWPAVAGVAAVIKIALYLRRKIVLRLGGASGRPLVSALRLGLAFVLPATLWAADEPGLRWIILGSVLVGELIDRGEFYDELEIPTPSGAMWSALHGARRVSDARARAVRAA